MVFVEGLHLSGMKLIAPRPTLHFWMTFVIVIVAVFLKATSASCKITVALQPLGKVTPRPLALVQRNIAAMYDTEVEILPAQTPPRHLMQKGRYRVETLLPWLDAATPSGYDRVIALTTHPLSVARGKSIYNGVSGYGFLNQRPCVVSTALLNRGNRVKAVFECRLIKVANHELAHTLGLEHCPDKRCLMADMKGTLKTLDRRRGGLCTSCRYLITKSFKRSFNQMAPDKKPAKIQPTIKVGAEL